MITVNYINSKDCTVTCFAIGGDTVESDNLIQELAHNISTTILPKLSQIVTLFKSQLRNITDSLNTTYATELPDYGNVTDENYVTNGNQSIFNISEANNEHFNITDLTYSFIDYLTFVLHSFVGSNETILMDDFVETTSLSSTTDIATTDFSAREDFENFKSTVIPFIVKSTSATGFSDNGRFDYDLGSLYDEITSTVNTIKENCTKICENVQIPLYKNITSVTVYDSEKYLNYTMKARLRSLCWETMFGQELIKVTVMDFVMTIASTLSMDFFRGVFVRIMNR